MMSSGLIRSYGERRESFAYREASGKVQASGRPEGCKLPKRYKSPEGCKRIEKEFRKGKSSMFIAGMSKVAIVLLIILVVLIIALVVLYFMGKRLQKKQNAQQEQMEATKQTMSLLIIDKKMLPVKDSGLPQMVIDQTPKLMRRSKLPIVKVKAGPRIMTMVADSKIFDLIPVKKEVKAVVSGIYIMEVKGIRAPLETKEKKKGLWARAKEKVTSIGRS